MNIKRVKIETIDEKRHERIFGAEITEYKILIINENPPSQLQTCLMNFNNFEDESEGRDYYGHFSESPNYHLLDILSSEKNPFLDEEIYDSDDSNILSNVFPEQSKSQETENHVPSMIDQSEAQEPTLEETENISTHVKKTKLIQKKNDPTRKRNKKSKEQNGKTEKKTKGNKSKYNNMGGFLIGSLTYFLNNRFSYRFVHKSYEIEIEGKWVEIEKIKVDSEKPYIEGMRKLKKDIDALPRRDGSKQDLFKLVNDQPKDSDLRKEFKRLIRKELVINLENEEWLKEHADSRDFKPNNDLDGSKKKERHEAYFTYLNAIKEALIEKGELPKRLNL